jgi:hypothetical protein
MSSRARLITTIKCVTLASFCTMLAAEPTPNPCANAALPARESLEIHHSKISLHHAKAGYSYPTIRLPHTFAILAGLSTRIYQTVHQGAFAFLVVVSSANTVEKSAKKSKNAAKNAESSVFTRRRSPVQIRPSPSFFLQSDILGRALGICREREL